MWESQWLGRVTWAGDPVETFRIRAVPGEDSCTLVLSGEADLEVAPDILELGMTGLGEASMTTLIVDLGEVTFIDSTTIGALIRLHNVADQQGKRLALDNVSRRVSQVLELAGLTGFFGIV